VQCKQHSGKIVPDSEWPHQPVIFRLNVSKESLEQVFLETDFNGRIHENTEESGQPFEPDF